VLNDQQQVALWIGTITDIHEQRTFREKLEQEVAQRTMDLQRSNNDLQQFAHVASHDLKEPVRKVRTFVSRLQQEFNEVLPLQAQNYLAKIDASTSRMYNMIDGVLLYSSLNAAEIQPEPVDLNELIQTIEADLEIAITQKQAVLHCVSLPVISGSGVLLYQLFYNLINNSLKFAQPHLPPVIHISADVQRNETGKGGMIGQASHYCKIVMQDNGIGFQEDEAHKIFDAFVRLHSKDKYEGTGLGLSLCKNIVERHGGRIAAKGEENKGACFTILLPM
jgi:light-regulated signal transduction histidine kinase (bacteriophytochrome)